MRSAVQSWIDNLTGPDRGNAGSARAGGTPGNALAAALANISNKPEIGGSFQAPAIAGRYEPRPPAPYPGQQPMRGIPPVAPSSQGGGGRDLGGGARAAGLQKLGAGIEQAASEWAAKRAKVEADLAAVAARQPVAPLARPGASTTVSGRSAVDTSAPPNYSPSPIGPAGSTPTFAQPGLEDTRAIPPIGGGGSLPTFAAGQPVGSPTNTAGGGGIAALRYNNPGNISLPMAGWDRGGEVVGIRGQPGYARFPDMQTGMDAFQHRVANYIDSRGLNTIGDLNSVYATDPNWAAGVARASGLGINTPLDTSNSEQMSALQRGILTQEMGPANANRVLSAPPASSPAPAMGAAAYAATPPSTAEQPVQPPTADQPPLLNGGQPGVYSMPGPQSMNDQTNPLAAALAGQGDSSQPPLMSPGMVDLADIFGFGNGNFFG